MSYFTQEAKTQSLLQALAKRLQKTNRIASGDFDLVTKVVRDGKQFPAWTDMETITLNDTRLKIEQTGVTREALAAILGVNYHELAHCLYTPNVRGTLAQTCAREGIFHYFNVLEDQRAEMLFSTKYSQASSYFTASCVRFLTDTKEKLENNYPLIHGRKFLPLDLRMAFRSRSKMTETALTEVEGLIDLYLQTVPAEDEDVALNIIRAFARVLNSNPPPASSHHDQNTTQTKPPRTSPEEQREQSGEVSERVNDDEDERRERNESSDKDEDSGSPEAGDDSDDDSDYDDDGSDADGEGSGSESEGDASPEGEQSGGDSDAEGETDGQSEDADSNGGSGGSGASRGNPASNKDIKDALQDALEDVLDDREAQRELDGIRDELLGDTEYDAQESLTDGTRFSSHRSASGELMSACERVAEQIRDVFVRAEMNYHRDQRQGFLNPMSHATANPWELDIFDDWSDGVAGEHGSLEVVLLADQSSSMWHTDVAFSSKGTVISRMDACLQAIHALAYGFLQAPEATVTVISYHDAGTFQGKWKSEERHLVQKARYLHFGSTGGTYPVQALQAARDIMATSQAETKVVINVTDGQWSMSHSSDGIVGEMKSLGVHTALFGIARAVGTNGSHGHDVAMDVATLDDVVLVSAALVTRLVAEAMHV